MTHKFEVSHSISHFKSVVFNGVEIAPRGGEILCVKGVISWFITFGGRFHFPGGRFCRL